MFLREWYVCSFLSEGFFGVGFLGGWRSWFGRGGSEELGFEIIDVVFFKIWG